MVAECSYLAWHVFDSASTRPVVIQFITEMEDGGQQVMLQNGLRIIIPKKMLERFTEVADPKWPVREPWPLHQNRPDTGGVEVSVPEGGKELARAAGNALDAMNYLYNERWRRSDL